MSKRLVSLFLVVILALIALFITYGPHNSVDRSLVQKSTQGTKHYRIALIEPFSDPAVDDIIEGFIKTLRSYSQFTFKYTLYDANKDRALMRSQIEDAITQQYDLLVPIGSQAAQMTKELTEKRRQLIPILFMGTGDPVTLGLVKTLECSGNHVTGVTPTGRAWIKKMLRLIPVLSPRCKRVLIPYDPSGLGGSLESYKDSYLEVLNEMGIEALPVQVYNFDDIKRKIPVFLEKNVDMLISLPDGTMLAAMDAVAHMCDKKRVPIYMSMNLRGVRHGASFSYGYSQPDMGMLAADMAFQILYERALPTNIPVDGLGGVQSIMINKAAAERQGVFESLDPAFVSLLEQVRVIR